MYAQRYLWFVILTSLGVCLLLVYEGYARYSSTEQQQQRALRLHAEGTAHEIELKLSALQKAVKIFAYERQADLAAIAANPADESTFEVLQERARQHFPGAFAVTVANTSGEPLVDQLDGNIEGLCLEELNHFANHDERWHGPRIHPNPLGYHFDILARWRDVIFFVSFRPDSLIELLDRREQGGQRLYLVDRANPRMIEVSSRGSRDRLGGNHFLDQAALGSTSARLPVKGSGWELIAAANPNQLEGIRRGLVVSSLAILAAFVFVSGALLWFIRKSESARETAQAANQFKSRFLSVIGHDIRSPMNSLLGYQQLLEQTPLTSRQRDYVNGTREASEYVLHLLNDLLDLSRLEAGGMQLELRTFEIRTTTDKLSRIFSGQARSKQLDFTCKVDDAVPAEVIGDPLRLQQILGNLLGNAIKFTENGLVRLHVSLLEQNGQRAVLRFEVEDTGIGVDAKQQAMLFEDYVQASTSIQHSHGGSGLGLAICRQLVGLMGGRVDLLSSAGHGSIFILDLPLALPTQTSPSPQVTELIKAQPGIALLVDDDPLSLDVYAQLLKRIGWRSRRATNIATAMLELANTRVDLVLLDGHLQQGETLPEIPRLRALIDLQGDAGEVPFILISGDTSAGKCEQYLQQGVDACLVKPIEFSLLKEQIAKLFGNRETLSRTLHQEQDDLFDPECMERMRELRPDSPESMLGELFQLFARESIQHLRAFDKALDSADWQGLREAAHGLKSCSTIIGARHLIGICKAVEQENIVETVEQGRAIASMLRAELSRVSDFGLQFQARPPAYQHVP